MPRRQATDDVNTRDEAAPGHAYTPPGDGQRQSHPMSQQQSGKGATAKTDQRDAAHDETQGLGGNWTGETESDREFRERPPTRGGDPAVDANDAF